MPTGKLTILRSRLCIPAKQAAFLTSVANQGVPVTLLGWDPPPVGWRRPLKQYYFSDKLYTFTRFLVHCAPRPDATVLLTDVDEIVQMDLATMRERATQLLATTEVVLAAEVQCLPPTAIYATRRLAMSFRPLLPERWPRCPNSGNLVGSVRGVVGLLNETCGQCLHMARGDGWRHYARNYSYELHGAGLMFRNQPRFTHVYLARADHSRLSLDFGQRIGLPLWSK